jgi:hypothetical protein
MNDSSSGFWGAIGALAAVAGVIVTIVIWQENKEADADTSGGTEPNFNGSDIGNGDGGDPGGDDTGSDDESGSWEQSDSYLLSLPVTYQEDHCWELQFDLDEGGYTESVDSGGPYADWAELTWSSCGAGAIGYLYGYWASSATVGSGASQDIAGCADAIGDDSYLELLFDPDNPTSDEGCLYTSEQAFATVTVDYTQWNGDNAVEGRVYVTVWTWNE